MDSKAISDSLWDLLQRLNSIPEMKCSYLGGGTALALQLEHRISEDLDFFIMEGFDDLAFKKAIQRKALNVFVVNQTPNHLELMLDSIKVDLIRERIPLKFPLKSIDSRMENLKMADPRDIGRMKIMSIRSRGNKKDFVSPCVEENLQTTTTAGGEDRLDFFSLAGLWKNRKVDSDLSITKER